MKYWIYKDSRILGPFEKDAFSGLPGVDSSTLVCSGDSIAAVEGDWRPAGDVADLASIAIDRGPAWPTDDLTSTFGVLDKLQLDAAGLIGDDEFPGAAEDLFQDPDMKRTFSDLLAPRSSAAEAELRRAKDRTTELTVQLEMLYRRVSELEAGQTGLMQRLAEKEMQLRGLAAAPASFLHEAVAAPAPVPAPAAPAAFAAAPSAPPPSAPPPSAQPSPEPPPIEAAAAPAGILPGWPPLAPENAEPSALTPLAPVDAAPASFPAAPEPPPTPSPSVLFLPAEASPAPVPSFPPPSVPPAPAELPGSASVELTAPVVPPAPAQPPKKALFERKTFKIVPTVKTFRVVGSEASAAVPSQPAAPAAPAAAPAAAAFDWSGSAAPAEPAVPAAKASPEPTAFELSSAPTTSIPFSAAQSSPALTPAPVPPATLSFGSPPASESESAPLPGFASPGRNFINPETPEAPPETARRPVPEIADGGDMVDAPSTQEALARLAKPAPEPTAAPIRRRSNKPFLIAACALVIVMGVVVALFLRHPKELKQMTELDDGRARVGAEPVDDQTHLPMVKPPMAAPPTDVTAPASSSPAPVAPAAEAPQAASQAKIDAAIAAVKDFPLDGDRGTVAELLQFSYSAVPGAGQESWNGSETGPNTYLVEYRFTPAAPGAADKHYLFEVDMERGLVIGKNLDAQNMLAGGPREEPKAKAKSKAKPKKTAKRAKAAAHRAATEDLTPKDVPLLPLPNEGELRPPAEDDGAFNADTVNSDSGL